MSVCLKFFISVMIGFSRAQLDQINQHPKSKKESKASTLDNELWGLCFLKHEKEYVTWPQDFVLVFGVRCSLQDADLTQYFNFPPIPVIYLKSG